MDLKEENKLRELWLKDRQENNISLDQHKSNDNQSSNNMMSQENLNQIYTLMQMIPNKDLLNVRF